jgi:hypothetical protein
MIEIIIIIKKKEYKITNNPLKPSFIICYFKCSITIIMCFEEWNYKKKKRPKLSVLLLLRVVFLNAIKLN